MATFALKTDRHPGVLMSKESLSQCYKGIEKRIRKEKKSARASHDKLYRCKRYENIQKLRIIKNELHSLLKLIYETGRD
jgi:hypothetical protein